jgi:hypothetical protein
VACPALINHTLEHSVREGKPVRKLTVSCLVVLLAVSIAAQGFAQERVVAIEKGKQALAVSGMYTFDGDSTWMVQVYWLKYVTDHVGLGLSGLLAGGEGTQGAAVGRFEYDFFDKERPSRTIPYIQVLAGRGWSEGDSASLWGGGPGVKFFVDERRFIALEGWFTRCEGETVKSLVLQYGTLF